MNTERAMTAARYGGALVAAAMLGMASPAPAQFFYKSPVLPSGPVTGVEPGMMVDLPGATEAERRAGLAWTLRAALNVAGLQCQFSPTLHSARTYNALIVDHKDELDKSLTTLNKYFSRLNKAPKAAAAAFDSFSTRTYAGFSTVGAQYIFCQTAASVATEALFAPRGSFATVAERRMRELRASLTPVADQQWPWMIHVPIAMRYVRLDPRCWSGRDRYDSRRCGDIHYY